MMRRTYSLTFKYKVIKQALETENPSKVARENKLNSLTIYRWIREYKQGKYEGLVPNEK
ncbi:helix-turn-helix domain-containing protein [Aneurinibacillus thermoaerophilus]|jgi:transposase-like protein|uniref:helix-turn-helix domain-containing protein n=1 Tax=Aneurinibacillus thermoaerophilus TaxID=143495 RepID=UPI002E1A96AD|nr:helix-turn-helix domain-containing protein [Aneurinibacillus thermoaerophilus]MED0761919.1 helix-turn-helix domain-containing protein [Aneurinibacillus thermoaerophilus]